MTGDYVDEKSTGAQLDIQQGGGAKGKYIKMCIILNHEKKLPCQFRIFWGKFFFNWGHSFSLGQNCVGRILN